MRLVVVVVAAGSWFSANDAFPDLAVFSSHLTSTCTVSHALVLILLIDRLVQEVKMWFREDDFGNVVAKGIVGEDDPNDEKYNIKPGEEEKKKEEEAKAKQVEGATTNRCVCLQY